MNKNIISLELEQWCLSHINYTEFSKAIKSNKTLKHLAILAWSCGECFNDDSIGFAIAKNTSLESVTICSGEELDAKQAIFYSITENIIKNRNIKVLKLKMLTKSKSLINKYI